MTIREWLLTWMERTSRPLGYTIRVDDGPPQEVTLLGYIEAEREAGFHGPGHAQGEPSTLAFVGRLTHGIGVHARSIKIEGKVLLQ
jgi:hypothetical protein